MSKAPAPSAIRGGSPGEPKVTCAIAGLAMTPASSIPIAASIACLPMVDRFTAVPLPWPRRGILGAIGAAASETDARGTHLSAPLGPLAGHHQLFADPGL